MDKLVKWTNKFKELYPPDKEKEYLQVWEPTCKEELYMYLAVLIYIGITSESCIEDYWGDLNTNGTEHIVKKYIESVRFGQLDCYF